MNDCGPILVAADQDRREKFLPNLVERLVHENVPAIAAAYVPVDLVWTVPLGSAAFDLKTPKDLVASVTDGRLHNQMKSMQDMGCVVYGFIVHGQWMPDLSWDENTYENQLLRLEYDGAKITRCKSSNDITSRIASLWRWTRDSMSKTGSYHAPTVVMPDNDYKSTPPLIFYDQVFRSQCGMLMHLPGLGPKIANSLRETHSLMDLLGITEEGLDEAKARWKAIRGIGPKLVMTWEGYLRS